MKFLALIAILVSTSFSATKSTQAECYEAASEMFEEFNENLKPNGSDDAFGRRISIAFEFQKVDESFKKNNGNTCTHLKVMARKINKNALMDAMDGYDAE